MDRPDLITARILLLPCRILRGVGAVHGSEMTDISLILLIVILDSNDRFRCKIGHYSP